MGTRTSNRKWASLLVGVLLAAGVPALAQGGEDLESVLREVELERNRLLVAGDVVAVDPYHAADFLLVNPFGEVIDKIDFLGALDQGALEFMSIDLSNIQVRVYGDGAALRYLSRIQVRFQGEVVPAQDLWHVVTYERNDGVWQAVWSVASEVRPGPLPPEANAGADGDPQPVLLEIYAPPPPRISYPEFW